MLRSIHAPVVVFAIVYLLLVVPLASTTNFWFDELFTYYIANLPSAADIVGELQISTDHHAPPHFLLARWCGQLVHPVELGYRLPGIFGFLTLCICLYYFVARRTSPVYGAVAMLTPVLSRLSVAMVDARPYGAAAGCCATALLCWQASAEGRARKLALPVMALAIAGAISMSYYSILLLAPLACAEFSRLFDRRKPDWGVMSAVLAGASVSFVYLGLVLHSVSGFSEQSWARPSIDKAIQSYSVIFGDATLVWIGILFIAAAVPIVVVSVQPGSGDHAFSRHELVLAGALILLPLLGALVAFMGAKMITPRYVISSLAGFAILFSSLCYRLGHGSALAGLCCLAVVMGGSVLANRDLRGRLASRTNDIRAAERIIPQASARGFEDLPVAIGSMWDSFEIAHYADPALRSRIVHLADPDAAAAYTGTRQPGKGLRQIQRYSPIRVAPMAEFRRHHPRYLLYSSNDSYQPTKLLDDGARLQMLYRGKRTVYLVEEPR